MRWLFVSFRGLRKLYDLLVPRNAYLLGESDGYQKIYFVCSLKKYSLAAGERSHVKKVEDMSERKKPSWEDRGRYIGARCGRQRSGAHPPTTIYSPDTQFSQRWRLVLRFNVQRWLQLRLLCLHCADFFPKKPRILSAY